jgi:hypothetical protein
MDYADENKLMGFANDIIESAGVVDLAGGDLLVEAQASPNMSVKVSPGTIYIENSSWVQNGNETHYFQCFSTEIENLNINSNSSGSERVDLICAKIDKVNDPGDYGELAFTLVAVEGTAGGGVPATPANHQKLAEIAVASGATSITSGDITDSRVEWTTKGNADTLDGKHLTEILQTVYPVGSIYISIVSTNPATLFGFGTWEAFATGKTLVGIDTSDTAFDTVEKTGGAKTHTLQTTEIPAHYHNRIYSLNDSQTLYTGDSVDSVSNQMGVKNNSGATSGAYKDTLYTSSAGGGGSHNNLQPYIVTYIWKRTA